MNSSRVIRQCAVAGMFYPSDPVELQELVSSLLASVQKRKVQGKIRGVVSPHAGYVYSGSTAASGFALLAGASYKTVVVVSPSHREFFDGVSAYPGDAYNTPLGEVAVDRTMRDRLIEECDIVVASEAGHGQEHAIEVQLPFLLSTIRGFSLLPLVMGRQSGAYCRQLGEALGSLLRDKEALLVASSDLSHYHPANVAERLDRIVREHLQRFDAEGLMNELEKGSTEACGGGPVVAVMVALRLMGVDHMDVVYHCNSGDVSGDSSSVVGYLSAVAYR